jgi:RNA polymerase sigma-70 factor (ECF subfamily)
MYDASLVGRIAHGDKAAMQGLFVRHQVRVYRFVLRLLGNEALAEDVTSEVFLDVWRRSAARFEGRASVSTWLLAIARYKALEARGRNNTELDETALDTVPDLADGPEESVQKKDRSATLRQCLAALSVEHREIVDLVYYHEKSVEEAAAILDIPTNTVKTRMFYARKRLAGLLMEAGLDQTSI